eukprot:CAMPEP_0202694828 /NCGR_PEP_ID=MMETSP1385-20130828/8583_1 /ASSEMBLY_ACC=CAM_ASM_000861 /TAXON_ID=933848 /ORGANISM="Elphidium margaritaceum" /LENGTH=449 /DNA_ID=CAMNT_0049350739 /DNA_START=48 /DNA_END=1397 /DNA_ORIENTATION=+
MTYQPQSMKSTLFTTTHTTHQTHATHDTHAPHVRHRHASQHPSQHASYAARVHSHPHDHTHVHTQARHGQYVPRVHPQEHPRNTHPHPHSHSHSHVHHHHPHHHQAAHYQSHAIANTHTPTATSAYRRRVQHSHSSAPMHTPLQHTRVHVHDVHEQHVVDNMAHSITKATVFGYIRLNVITPYIIPEEIMMLCYDYYGHDFISSTILNGEERDKLFRLLMKQKPNLIPGTTFKVYNAMVDGFDAKSFYSKCNGISPSILVIKSNWGKIFGAFTQIAWQFDGGYHAEQNVNNTFLYSLNSAESNSNELNDIGQIFKIKKRDVEYAVFHGGNGARDLDSDLIFYYGAAAGLLLYENCNLRDDNFAYGGEKCGYQIPRGNMLCGGHKVNTCYSDKYEFRVENFELFTVELEMDETQSSSEYDDDDDEYDEEDDEEEEDDDDDDDDVGPFNDE